jgi:PAS domain-containing protein
MRVATTLASIVALVMLFYWGELIFRESLSQVYAARVHGLSLALADHVRQEELGRILSRFAEFADVRRVTLSSLDPPRTIAHAGTTEAPATVAAGIPGPSTHRASVLTARTARVETGLRLYDVAAPAGDLWLSAEFDTAPVFANYRGLQFVAALGFLGILVIGGLARTYFLRRELFAPLDTIFGVLQRRMDGDREVRVPAGVSGEFDRLATALNEGFDRLGALEQLRQEREAELKRAVCELAAQDSLLQFSSRATGYFMWECGRDLRLRYITAGVEPMLGYRVEESIGQSLPEFLDRHEIRPAPGSAAVGEAASERDFVDATIRRVVEDGQTAQDVRWTLTHRDGHPVDVTTTCVPLYDDAGGICAMLGVTTDITKRRRTEEILAESSRFQAVGQLTGGLAHDFNNMLGVVIGNLELLQPRVADDSVGAARVAAALDAALRGAQVSRRLLSVARRPDPDVEARELNSDIEELLPLLRTTAGATIAVAWQRWEGPVAVSLEADGFANALLNLVVNARDALEGVVDPRIDVALRRARFAVDEDPLLAATVAG